MFSTNLEQENLQLPIPLFLSFIMFHQQGIVSFRLQLTTET